MMTACQAKNRMKWEFHNLMLFQLYSYLPDISASLMENFIFLICFFSRYTAWREEKPLSPEPLGSIPNQRLLVTALPSIGPRPSAPPPAQLREQLQEGDDYVLISEKSFYQLQSKKERRTRVFSLSLWISSIYLFSCLNISVGSSVWLCLSFFYLLLTNCLLTPEWYGGGPKILRYAIEEKTEQVQKTLHQPIESLIYLYRAIMFAWRFTQCDLLCRRLNWERESLLVIIRTRTKTQHRERKNEHLFRQRDALGWEDV